MEVYYNPDMPIESVVDRGVGKQTNLYLIEVGLFLLVTGAIIQIGLSLTSGKKEEEPY